MILRAVGFLGCVFFLALISFRILVDSEVQRVMSVHVTDKAGHLVDMLAADPATPDLFVTADATVPGLTEFLEMADAIHVTAIDLFDETGRSVGRLASDHAGSHMAGPGHGGGHNGHDHAHHNPTKASLLAGYAAPDQDRIRAMIAGPPASRVIIDSLNGPDNVDVHIAYVLIPIDTQSGRLGYAGFLVDVSHIFSIYAEGATTFGILFMVCGVVLFGVPGLAFWVQKRMAERSSRDARYLSRHDPLTGLLNRSAFVTDAEKRLTQGSAGFAAYIDVDRFKQINDTYGHTVGDAYLRHVAQLLRTTFGPEALIARLGGDEFTILLPRQSKAKAQARLQGLLQDAAKEIDCAGLTLSASLSMGVAIPTANDSCEALLQRADMALYCAKYNGRNRLSFFSEDMGAAARRRRMLETRLKEACRDEAFEIFYQPLVDAQTFQTTGYEALLRLKDAEGTPIPPDEFVPIAEDIGLIEEIGAWVLHTATAAISALDDHAQISVNLSADQFRSHQLVATVASALEKSGLPPERLELEITESILLESEEATKLQIDALKDMGVGIAMDDFGTGFSSISTLWKFGFDRLKIDKSFVFALEESPEKSKQLIGSIVLLGARMGMSITAEGVETAAQRDILTDLGCNMLQGFLFGRPAAIPTDAMANADHPAAATG